MKFWKSASSFIFIFLLWFSKHIILSFESIKMSRNISESAKFIMLSLPPLSVQIKYLKFLKNDKDFQFIVNLKFCETYPNLRRSRCSLCLLTLSKIKFLRFSQTDPMEFSWPREGQKNKVDGEIFPLYFGTLGIVLLYLLFDQWFLAPTYFVHSFYSQK